MFKKLRKKISLFVINLLLVKKDKRKLKFDLSPLTSEDIARFSGKGISLNVSCRVLVNNCPQAKMYRGNDKDTTKIKCTGSIEESTKVVADYFTTIICGCNYDEFTIQLKIGSGDKELLRLIKKFANTHKLEYSVSEDEGIISLRYPVKLKSSDALLAQYLLDKHHNVSYDGIDDVPFNINVRGNFCKNWNFVHDEEEVSAILGKKRKEK